MADRTVLESVAPFDPRNGTYSGFDEIEATVRLDQGQWQGEPWSEGSAVRPKLILLDGVAAAGDLDGDGEADAVYLLNLAMGGTGQLLYVAAVPASADSTSVVTASLVGDRVKVRYVDIVDGRVRLDVLQAGPEDAMCCPGELATRFWTLSDGMILVEGPSEVPVSRFRIASLQGSEWQLERWSWDESAAGSGVTLTFVEDAVAGSSGCNRYSAAISDGVSPGEITVGPAMGTRMACPEEQSAVESRFLGILGGAEKLGFLQGQLSLTSRIDGGIQTLFFKPAEP